uniref:Serpentine receptor class gamma n=1 Tax=Caenorhabditis tropicalis TaxID=1561998 RepID=A0A1I7TNQ5_9PELO
MLPVALFAYSKSVDLMFSFYKKKKKIESNVLFADLLHFFRPFSTTLLFHFLENNRFDHMVHVHHNTERLLFSTGFHKIMS